MVYTNPFLIWTPTPAEGGTATRNLYDEAAAYGIHPTVASSTKIHCCLQVISSGTMATLPTGGITDLTFRCSSLVKGRC